MQYIFFIVIFSDKKVKILYKWKILVLYKNYSFLEIVSLFANIFEIIQEEIP